MSVKAELRRAENLVSSAAGPGKRGKCPPVATILRGLQGGLTVPDIARQYGVASGSIYASMRKHGIDISQFLDWKKSKADVMSFAQSRIIESAMGKIAETGFRDLVTGFNILNNAERLERGLSTANVDVAAALTSIDVLNDREAKLQAALDKLEGKDIPDE